MRSGQATETCTKLNKDKCKALHPGHNVQRAQKGLGCTWLGNSVAERDLEVLGDNKLNMSQQSSAAATGKSCPGLHPQGHD